MHTGVHELTFELLFFHAVNWGVGHFIVESVEDWFDSCINEAFVACIIALHKVICPSALDWFSKDCIGITVMKCEHTAVPF